jgi:NAD+ diphosphatase
LINKKYLFSFSQEEILDEHAYFFQGDSLLLPKDFTDSLISAGLPVNLSSDFNNSEKFEISAINASPALINAVSIPPEIELSDNWKKIPVRHLLFMFFNEGGSCIENIIRACHIAQWRSESCFCGSCGSKNTDVPAQAQRICPKCGRIEFPRICPAVITIITDDKNRILLARNKRFRSGVYSHISGFNEAGETLEETVVREIREEVNIEVNNIVYVKSQPWPFPNSLMIGFKARYLSGTIQPDGDEIEDARWFTRDNLPELPAEGSLSRFLINCWLAGT